MELTSPRRRQKQPKPHLKPFLLPLQQRELGGWCRRGADGGSGGGDLLWLTFCLLCVCGYFHSCVLTSAPVLLSGAVRNHNFNCERNLSSFRCDHSVPSCCEKGDRNSGFWRGGNLWRRPFTPPLPPCFHHSASMS